MLTKLQISVMMALPSKLTNKTPLRPRVSAIKPQMCDVATVPMNATDDRMPFSLKLKFRSHWAAGIMNIMLVVSIMTDIKHNPAVRMMK